MAVAALTACENADSGLQVENNTKVTLSFSPYDSAPIASSRRAAVAISTYATHLDIWLVSGDEVIDLHQSSTDNSFGTLAVDLNKTKTYTLYAVAHKCTDNATLSNGIISFPEEKVTHAFFYTTTFSPATTTELSCTMPRIVGQFRLEITDAVPDEVAKFNYTINDTYTRWNVAGTGSNQIDRTGTINVTSKNNDGSVTINIFLIPTNLTDTDHLDITFTALTSTDAVVETHTFNNVPVKANYKTTCHGTFFVSASATMTFLADDWEIFDTIDF